MTQTCQAPPPSTEKQPKWVSHWEEPYLELRAEKLQVFSKLLGFGLKVQLQLVKGRLKGGLHVRKGGLV